MEFRGKTREKLTLATLILALGAAGCSDVKSSAEQNNTDTEVEDVYPTIEQIAVGQEACVDPSAVAYIEGFGIVLREESEYNKSGDEVFQTHVKRLPITRHIFRTPDNIREEGFEITTPDPVERFDVIPWTDTYPMDLLPVVKVSVKEDTGCDE